MNVLITGGAGFIGSHIAEHLQGQARVRVLDNRRSGFRRNPDGLDVEFIEASILDREALRRAMARGEVAYSTGQVILVDGGLTLPRL